MSVRRNLNCNYEYYVLLQLNVGKFFAILFFPMFYYIKLTQHNNLNIKLSVLHPNFVSCANEDVRAKFFLQAETLCSHVFALLPCTLRRRVRYTRDGAT